MEKSKTFGSKKFWMILTVMLVTFILVSVVTVYRIYNYQNGQKKFIFIKPLMILRYLNRTTTTALRQQNIALILLTMVTEEILRLHITGNAVQWKSY